MQILFFSQTFECPIIKEAETIVIGTGLQLMISLDKLKIKITSFQAMVKTIYNKRLYVNIYLENNMSNIYE